MAAEKKKEAVRKVIKQMQEDFEALEADIMAQPPDRRLQSQQMLVDPQYAQMLEDEGAAMINEVNQECQYASEMSERRLAKLRARYLEPVETEMSTLEAFRSGQSVATFGTMVLEGPLKDLLDKVHNMMRGEELSNARAKVLDAHVGGGAAEGAPAEKATGKSANIDAPSTDADGAEASKEPKEKLSTMEIRKIMRNKRADNLAEMERKKPGKDDDDPADLAAIAYAENNMGDYKLKMADDYEVPEDQAVNSEKKRRQVRVSSKSTCEWIRRQLSEARLRTD